MSVPADPQVDRGDDPRFDTSYAGFPLPALASSVADGDPAEYTVGPFTPGLPGPRRRPRIGALPTLPLGDPTGGADALAWRQLVDGPSRYPHVAIDRDVHIRMSDGIVLRATVIRPAGVTRAAAQRAYPAVVSINPYNRAILDVIDQLTHAHGLGRLVRGVAGRADLSGTPLAGITDLTRMISGGALDVFGVNRNLVRSGYVQVIVDVRGTGASHGKWQILGPREQQDSVEICRWVTEQDWCDGTFGLAGWSYSAITSLQAADKRPPGLKAVFAIEGCEDIVRDIYITGGLPSAFIPLWMSVVNGLKWIPNPAHAVRDLMRGTTAKWLLDRIASPATEAASLGWGFLTGHDPRIYDDPYFRERNPVISRIDAPTFLFGAWHDLFGRSATSIYQNLQMEPGRKQLIVADGYHLDVGSGFGEGSAPPRVDVLERAWFDKWLKGIDNGVDAYGPVTMQQQGGSWTAGESFPRPGVSVRHLHLGASRSGTAAHSTFDGSLGSQPSPAGRTNHTVSPDLRGLRSRDMTQVTAGLTVMFGRDFTHDARYQERGALSFTTPPALARTQISGALNLHLFVSTSGQEGIWAVTVNDVAPDGSSRVVTNGALTVSNRAFDRERSQYAPDGTLLVAHHYLSRKRKLPVPKDVPLPIDVDLVPTDAVIEIGHRLRVDIYAGSVPRYLTVVPDLIRAHGRKQELVLDPDHPSYLTLQATGDPAW
ncbi:CocE/NonD family hydrolase [Williamsia sp. CHRR-6]|uniref:CocE/NonD family hydrolase n=1 Tax=Williamsia sp. CHRR-6 TaxID=2835871 RepID=UPI001BD9198E|nr:CocE/NonD family hydrolase [Williamsia sp. CHRR-6]MBT0565887.1 CocE/NonD family hydrolase [Williamsia sp. CHRR-6]